MKSTILFLFLLHSISGLGQVDKLHRLEINYKPLNDYFFPIDEIKLFNPDTAIIADSQSRLKNIPTGEYTLRFVSVYNDVFDTNVVFTKRVIERITPYGITRFYQFDSLVNGEYIIDKLNHSDTLIIRYFLSEEPDKSFDTIKILRHEDNYYYLIDADNSNDISKIKLSDLNIKEFKAWEHKIKLNDKSADYDCYSQIRNYTFILDHIVYEYTDKSCDEYDLEYLKNNMK